GGIASGAGAATRLVATRVAAEILATEGVNIVGERAALWAASQGGRRLLGRAALWAMGEAATESTARIGARPAILGSGVVVGGAVFHATMTGLQAGWGYLRHGEWVFPEPGEFALGVGQSILLMGSMSVGNAVWGRVAETIGVAPEQVARMTSASRLSRW